MRMTMATKRYLTFGTAAALVVLIVAIAVSSAAATTSPTNYKIFNVRLTDHGVVFSPKAQLQVGEVGLFRVRNTSKESRVFTVSGRSTHLLKTAGKEYFYEIFPQQGKVEWKSHTAKGKSFTGFIKVVPCKDTSGTSSCNGTDD